MPPSHLPAETVQQILDELVNCNDAGWKAAGISEVWLRQQRRGCFSNKVSFKNEADLVAFVALTSTAACTFPLPIPCEDLSFHGLTTMSNQGATAIAAVLPRVTPPRSLTIGIIAGEIPQQVFQALLAWKSSIREMKISGGTHSPQTFFSTLWSLPHLETLTLQDFKFKSVWTWLGQGRYAFPPTLKTLAVIGDASPYRFFLERVLPGGGFSNVATLSVQTRFLLDDAGVKEMLACFRGLHTIDTISLCPSYDAACRDLCRDMSSIFSSWKRPLVKIPELKSLKIDFSDIPAEWALNCLSICALYLPTRRDGLNVDIRVPRSPELWDEQGPAVQLEQLLEEVNYDNPLAATPSESTLTIRDFPAPLPDKFKAAPMLCRFPVVFVNATAYN